MENAKTTYRYSTLIRALQVQEIYQSKEGKGHSDLFIHATFIKPHYGISIRTMQRYLEIPAKRYLRQLQPANHED